MAHKKKDGRRISYYLDNEIYEKLSDYAEEMGQTHTMAIERILEAFFEDEDNVKKPMKRRHKHEDQ